MPYSNEKGYSPLTIEDIIDFYRSQVNIEFETNYDKTSFEGSGFWRTYLPAVYKDREIENAMMDLLAYFNESIKSLSDSYFFSEAGLLSGIQKSLKNLEEIVKDCNIYNPQNIEEYRGKIAVAIEYVNKDLEDNVNANSEIANTIINNIGAGIHTDETTADKKYLGVLSSNGQVFTVFWALAILKNVKLKLVYKKEIGYPLPDNDTIKNTLLEKLETYQFGQLFTPQRYVDSCHFPYFRSSKLYYSLDNDSSWFTEEITPEFREKYSFSLDNILLESEDI